MAHPAVPRGTGIAHDIAFRRFDLDYLGAEIAEDLRRQRPEHDGRQVEHLDPGERPRFGLAHDATRNMIISFAVTSPGEGHGRRPLRVSNISACCICSKSAAKLPAEVETEFGPRSWIWWSVGSARCEHRNIKRAIL